jgi:outer membrane lipoprotein SlyB
MDTTTTAVIFSVPIGRAAFLMKGERNMKISICGRKVGGYRPEGRLTGAIAWILLFMAVLALSACYPAAYGPMPQSMPAEAAAAQPAPSTQVYFYPTAGQTTEQQSRDHYECYNWAVQQTGFDPGQSAIPRNQRVSVVPMPPLGHDTVAFTIAGAVLGALIGGPHHAGGGAIIGATGGMMAGAASDSARAEYARQQEEAYVAQNQAERARLEEKAAGFRRAMCARLEGRGYTVR